MRGLEKGREEGREGTGRKRRGGEGKVSEGTGGKREEERGR